MNRCRKGWRKVLNRVIESANHGKELDREIECMADNPKHGIIKQCPDMWSNGGQLKTMLIPDQKKLMLLYNQYNLEKL